MHHQFHNLSGTRQPIMGDPMLTFLKPQIQFSHYSASGTPIWRSDGSGD